MKSLEENASRRKTYKNGKNRLKERQSIETSFLTSLLALDSKVMPNRLFPKWFADKKRKTKFFVIPIPLDKLDNWKFDNMGHLAHSSGGFFRIEGIRVKTSWGSVPMWEQPIINQPEIGLLGIIAKEINGILHFLMQVKAEPGNLNQVQLSPTVQATKSNYTKKHRGNTTPYLAYFLDSSVKKNVLLDQLQSEQGARFLKKRNRNMIIQIETDIEILENYCWLTLGQIHQLLKYDNIVNMDTRTVISGVDYGAIKKKDITNYFKKQHLRECDKYEYLRDTLVCDISLHPISHIISWITSLKSTYDLEIEKMSLFEINQWRVGRRTIYRPDRRYFSVIGIEAQIGNREVSCWTQPMVKPSSVGLIVFLAKKIKGVNHFLIQGRLEPGNFDVIELSPTIQCITGNYRTTKDEWPPYMEYFVAAQKRQIIYRSIQSEEGGRFYKEGNINMIVQADDLPLEVHDNYCWMTLNQIKQFIRFNNYLNIQARSLLAIATLVKI